MVWYGICSNRPTVCYQRSLTPPFPFFFNLRLYERFVYICISENHLRGNYTYPTYHPPYHPNPFPKTPNADAPNLFPQGSLSFLR